MRQTEEPPTSAGWRGNISLLSELWTLAAAVATVLAFLSQNAAKLAQPLALAVAVSMIATGVAEMYRLRHCPRRQASHPPADPAPEEGIDRLCIAAGSVQLAAAILLSPLAASVTGVLLAIGLGVAGTRRRRAADARATKGGRVRASFLVLVVTGFAFFAYAGLGIALVASDRGEENADPAEAKHHRPKDPATESDPGRGIPEGEPESDPMPTYADSCPDLRNPRLIGHGLGDLFEGAGAPKAGCGTMPVRVAQTGAWAAAGICEGEMRSLAVTGPDGPALLYGEAAEFAWEAALADELVGAALAAPAEGEVALVETMEGTFGFARSSPSISAGRENLRWCGEATGLARPFVRLPPPLLLLWVDLLEYRAAWSWPVGNPLEGDRTVTFLSYPRETVAADGGCESDSDCHLYVDGELWPNEGTAWVSMREVRTYMPSGGA